MGRVERRGILLENVQWGVEKEVGGSYLQAHTYTKGMKTMDLSLIVVFFLLFLHLTPLPFYC